MPRDPTKLLQDILSASELIRGFIGGRSLDEFMGDRMLQSAVERQFITIGEALRVLSECAPAVVGSVGDRAEIVGFRNVLTHNYSAVNARIVWDAATRELPRLVAEVEALAAGFAPDGSEDQ